jgi:hypothetical protein
MKREPQFPLRNLTGAPFHVLLKQPNGFLFYQTSLTKQAIGSSTHFAAVISSYYLLGSVLHM